MRGSQTSSNPGSDQFSIGYSKWIHAAPLLGETEEAALAERWRQHGDRRAMDELTASHMRLILKIARGYRGYGLPFEDLVSEGTLGFMKALGRFELGRGARLATFATWWIRAEILSYIINNWSLVKVATTTSQRTLFFRLRGVKARIHAAEHGDMADDDVTRIAAELSVPADEVVAMNRRLDGGTVSLNAPIGADDEGDSLLDWLMDDRTDQEQELADEEAKQLHGKLLAEAVRLLSPRERSIFTERRLSEAPRTLEQLSGVCQLSPARVRQIELIAVAKVERSVRSAARQLGLAPVTRPARRIPVSSRIARDARHSRAASGIVTYADRTAVSSLN